MEVIYKKKRIKLPANKCIKLEYYKTILSFRRLFRRFQLLYKYFKKYIVILICIIIYISLTTILGIKFNEYGNIYESIWENKNVIFTCLILPYFTAIYIDIKERKRKLSIEHYYYREFQKIIAKFIVYFNKNIESFNMIIIENKIEDILKNSEISIETNYNILFKKMNSLLNDMIKEARNWNYEYDFSSLFEKLKYENKKIYEIYKKNNKLTMDDTKEFQYKCNVIFHNISWMWTKDNDIHKKINKTIIS